MSNAPSTPPAEPPLIHVTNRGDLIATIPALLGFVPVHSAVVVGIAEDGEVTTTARLGLDNLDAMAAHLSRNRLLHPAVTAEIVIVGPGDPSTTSADGEPAQHVRAHQAPLDPRIPYATQLRHLATILDSAGHPTTHAAWTPAVSAGQPWRCYHDPHCGGLLPDPRSTVLAAVTALSGRITYPNRQALTDTLRPDPEPVLARRRLLTAARIAEHQHPDHLVIETAITRAQTGILPSSDADIAELAAALSDLTARHHSMRYCLGPTSRAAQRLWTTLVRATPAPYRAEPAVLLSISAHLDGNGPVATVAAQLALDANPEHTLARVLLFAIQWGLPPTDLRTAIDKSRLAP